MDPTKTNTYMFNVDLMEEGHGTLLVTDLRILLQAAREAQPYGSSYDTGRVASIMDLGDNWTTFDPVWYICTELSIKKAMIVLDRVWPAYFDYYSASKFWIDATAQYIGADGEVIHTQEVGRSDGDVTGTVKIYCREFWETYQHDGDPTQADWSDLLAQDAMTLNIMSIHFDELEERLAEGIPSGGGATKLIVIRPTEEPHGFTARGFNLIPYRSNKM